MSSTRRRFLLAGAWSGPVLACAALAAPAAAAEAETLTLETLTLETSGQKRDRTQLPASCPFCRPGRPCPEHLL